MKHQAYKGIIYEDNNFELEQLKREGFFIQENLLTDKLCKQLSDEIDRIWNNQVEQYGEDLLRKIGDWGQVRAMMKDSPNMCDLIINPEILKFVDMSVGDTSLSLAICSKRPGPSISKCCKTNRRFISFIHFPLFQLIQNRH